MTYARQRLWLGISGVGSTVLLCAAAIVFRLPHRIIPSIVDQRFATALAAIALTWMLHALLLSPLDFIGGNIVVPQRRSVLSWFASWLRGISVQWLWFALAASLLMRTAQQFGNSKAMLVFLLLQLALLSRQGVMAWLVGGLRILPTSPVLKSAASAAGIDAQRVREVDADDVSYVGAWSGVNAQSLWVPHRWVVELPSTVLAVVLARRVGVRELGLRRRGVLVALAWNTVGFALASAAPRADLVSAPGFVTTIAWFTLWSFLGVLVLPSLSRPAVFAADRWARSSHDANDVTAAINALDAWQDDEAARSRAIETIFHPVPSRDARLHALRQSGAPTDTGAVAAGAWHATRMMLYLSWAGLGGLSRAVHCNIGRPSLWVMLPGD
jgi:hypothetical protein